MADREMTALETLNSFRNEEGLLLLQWRKLVDQKAEVERDLLIVDERLRVLRGISEGAQLQAKATEAVQQAEASAKGPAPAPPTLVPPNPQPPAVTPKADAAAA